MQKQQNNFFFNYFKISTFRFYSYSLIIFKFTVFSFLLNCLSIYSKSNYYDIYLDLRVLLQKSNFQKSQFYSDLNSLNFYCNLEIIFFQTSHNLKNLNHYKKYINNLNYSFMFSLIGSLISLDVIGYVRRAWYRKKRNVLYFRLGFSCFTKLILHKVLILNLVKKRFLSFFSTNSFVLFFQTSLIRNLLKTNLYKYSGILYNQEQIMLKKSKKQKVGSSY